jgi:hypothetical protein
LLPKLLVIEIVIASAVGSAAVAGITITMREFAVLGIVYAAGIVTNSSNGVPFFFGASFSSIYCPPYTCGRQRFYHPFTAILQIQDAKLRGHQGCLHDEGRHIPFRPQNSKKRFKITLTFLQAFAIITASAREEV